MIALWAVVSPRREPWLELCAWWNPSDIGTSGGSRAARACNFLRNILPSFIMFISFTPSVLRDTAADYYVKRLALECNVSE